MKHLVICVDDAIKEYLDNKRVARCKIPATLCYDPEENKFIAFRDEKTDKTSKIVLFENCNKTYNEIMSLYLEQPIISRYKEQCLETMATYKDPEFGFLYFFDHVDVLWDFELFEYEEIGRRVIRWCKKKSLSYYYDGPKGWHTSWLTEERKNAAKKSNTNRKIDKHFLDGFVIGKTKYEDICGKIQPDETEYSSEWIVCSFTSYDDEKIILRFSGSELLLSDISVL